MGTSPHPEFEQNPENPERVDSVTSMEISVDEEVAALIRLDSLRTEQMLDNFIQSGMSQKIIDFHREVSARLSYLALGLEQGWLGDVRGEQMLELDLREEQS